MVDRDGLENRCAREGTVGSNPTLSAIITRIVLYIKGLCASVHLVLGDCYTELLHGSPPLSLQTHVFRRGGIYYFRMRVPHDVQKHVCFVDEIAILALPRELWRSLATACPQKARIRGMLAAALAYELFEKLKRTIMLTADQLRQLVVGFYRAELDEDMESRLEPLELWRVDWRDRTHELHMAELKRHLGRGEFVLVTWAADWLIERDSLPIVRDSREYRQLCQALMRTSIELDRRYVERDRGDFSGVPTDPLFVESIPEPYAKTRTPEPIADAAVLNPLGKQPVSPLLERVLNEKRDLRPKTGEKYRVVGKLFDQFTGNKPAGAVTRQDIVDFKDLLTRLPVNWTKRFPGKSPGDAIAANEKLGLPTLAPRNVNDSYLVYVNAFFKWAITNNIRHDNPASGIAVMTPKGFSRKQSRDPFSIAQLQRVFDAPIYKGCAGPGRTYCPGSHLVRDHRYWAPLIALFTGARLNELGQLEVKDLQMVAGTWCLRITTQGDTEEHGNIKQLKSEASKRIVPIHSELKALGFLAYVEGQRTAGQSRIFPKWQRGKDGTYSSVFSKTFNSQFLPRIGIKTPKLVFHSFRHTFVDAMRDAGIEEGIQKVLVGHSDQSTTAIYGKGHPAVRLSAAIEQIEYSGLDLAHLKPLGEPTSAAA